MKNSIFGFRLSTNLLFGKGESEKLGGQVKALGFAKIAAIVDQGVFNHPQISKSLESLRQKGIIIDIYKSRAQEPTYDYLESFRENLDTKRYDALIGIGGGSTLDLTKGIAVLLTNQGKAISFRGFPELKNKPLPVIAIPTTAGTGSEVTYNAVFTDSQQKKKLGINSILNFPVMAIIDPLIYIGCPRSVAVSAGCDALVHTLESFVNKNHTPVSRMYSKEAFRLVFNNLPGAIKENDNVDIWGNLALGAYLAGIALMNSGAGVAGAFSYPLGVHYKVPHGLAGALFTPAVVRMNTEKGYLDYVQLYDLIEDTDKGVSLKDKNAIFVRKIQWFMDILEVPCNFGSYKLEQKDIEFMIQQYEPLLPAINNNPIEFTKADIAGMFSRLF